MSKTKTNTRVLKVPDIDWVSIPAGEFIYGEDDEQTRLHLETFAIARYPITNRQYQCFIDDGGYEDGRWWMDLEKPAIEQSHWPQGNRPRTNVDWSEATAFVHWLSRRLDQNIRLPSKQEWEKAARGTDTDGRRYPWGYGDIGSSFDIDESNIGGDHQAQTRAVGLFPQEESTFGVRDTTGNVLEFCDGLDNNAGSKIGSKKSTPALRRGSFDFISDAGRSRPYGRLSPDYRSSHIGFRLVRSPP